MTEQQAQRTRQMLEGYAKEALTDLEMISGSLYAYGSELACLRIFAKYNTNGKVHNPNAIVGYSENLNTWYFRLETGL